MEKRWFGMGDKLARPGQGWTGRIRAVLRSVWKTLTQDKKNEVQLEKKKEDNVKKKTTMIKYHQLF